MRRTTIVVTAIAVVAGTAGLTGTAPAVTTGWFRAPTVSAPEAPVAPRAPVGGEKPAPRAGGDADPAVAQPPREAPATPVRGDAGVRGRASGRVPAPGGPVVLRPGDRGAQVRELQARLRQIAWFYGDVTDFFGDQTREAVAGFQTKRGFLSTGVIDRRTLTRLHEMTSEPTADELANARPDPADGTALDPRCLTGRVLCIDKSSSSLRWVVDGDVRLTMDARFGGNGFTTREGTFSVFLKSRDHVSSLYETSMPFAMFFSGGQAVHYSPDFAATGYAGASHGCVNTRDYSDIAWLFDQVRLGDRVIVYWS